MLVLKMKIFCIFSVQIYLVNCLLHDFPPDFKYRCNRYDPKLNECLLKATEVVRPFLVKGMPEIGIPSIDPLHIDQISLAQGTDALNFKAILNNIVVNGLTNYNFSRFDFDVPNLQWYLTAIIKPIELSGDFNVTGRVLIAPIEGKGTFKATLDHCDILGYQKVEIVKKKGVDYLRPIHTNTTINAGGIKVKLDGLFGNNEEVNQVTNRVINENVDVLFEDLRPVIEKIIVQIIEEALFKGIEDNIPFDKIYPPKS